MGPALPVPALRVEGLWKAFPVGDGALPVLAGVDLTVGRGEFVSLVGPSGCGKTTLLRIVAGLLEPDRGRVEVDGAPPREARRRKALGLVFQEPALLPWRTVRGNLLLPRQVNRRANRAPLPSPEALLQAVGLAGFAEYRPRRLSGGMRQRVALARALAHDPSVLLMDEPLGALDEITRRAMRYDLLQVACQAGKTVLMVTHSIPEAVALSDRVVVLSPRPARVRGVVPVPLPRPRTPDQEGTPAFQEAAEAVRRLLEGEG